MGLRRYNQRVAAYTLTFRQQAMLLRLATAMQAIDQMEARIWLVTPGLHRAHARELELGVEQGPFGEAVAAVNELLPQLRRMREDAEVAAGLPTVLGEDRIQGRISWKLMRATRQT